MKEPKYKVGDVVDVISEKCGWNGVTRTTSPHKIIRTVVTQHPTKINFSWVSYISILNTGTEYEFFEYDIEGLNKHHRRKQIIEGLL